jgi:HlyD family type I secretion membrane fusion protein
MRHHTNLAFAEPAGSVLDFSQALNQSRNRLIKLGAVVLALGFGGLGTWAAWAPLKSATLAQGVVKVASERKTLQHLEGGIVKDILVKEGQIVEAGQVLLRLDDINARARHALLQSTHDALSAELTRLEAERDELASLTFGDSLLSRRDDPRVARLLEGEMQLFISRRAAMQGQISVLRQRKLQNEERITGRETQIAATQIKLDYVNEEIKGAEELMEVGMYTKPKYFALKRAEADLSGDTGRLRAEIAETRALNGETDLRIMDMRNQMRREANDKLQEGRAKLDDTRERLDAAADALERTEIVARQPGTVIGLQIHTIGGVIKPGAAILDIVPSDDRMVVEARVRPEEIDQVHKGLPAEVRFTAFNARNTPVFPGTVTGVSADRFTDPARGLAYYLAQIEIDPKQVASLTLQPGMPAEVHIVTGERTALDYILKPIRDQIGRGMLEK